ncbi:hypothetical protein DIPPA_09255 [Diplonema papillatum]|nr:hypothetical protein DIPPA_09255 [Diplonema papillatum]
MDDDKRHFLKSAGGASERPSSTASTESFTLADMNEFVADVQFELVDRFGAAGRVSQVQLLSAFSNMGLDTTEPLVSSLWADASTPTDHLLSIHEVLQRVEQRLQLVTPPTSGHDTPKSHQSKRSKCLTPQSNAASQQLWWGYQPLADTL